jgi:hypothetical protein
MKSNEQLPLPTASFDVRASSSTLDVALTYTQTKQPAPDSAHLLEELLPIDVRVAGELGSCSALLI